MSPRFVWCPCCDSAVSRTTKWRHSRPVDYVPGSNNPLDEPMSSEDERDAQPRNPFVDEEMINFDADVQRLTYPIVTPELSYNELRRKDRIGLRMLKASIKMYSTDAVLVEHLKINGRPSVPKLMKKLDLLTPDQSHKIDCCRDGCVLFEDTVSIRCSICNQLRRNDRGLPFQTFTYIPLIPRLVFKLQTAKYRALTEYAYNFYNRIPSHGIHRRNDIYQDIYDGDAFEKLVHAQVIGNELGDIFVSIGLDGFSFQKKRKRSAWILVAVNESLSPEIRTKPDQIYILGVIPSSAKHPETFLKPLVRELKCFEVKHSYTQYLC
jgi:hypothetical protein